LGGIGLDALEAQFPPHLFEALLHTWQLGIIELDVDWLPGRARGDTAKDFQVGAILEGAAQNGRVACGTNFAAQ
jgi:hypothetical protein